MLVREVFDTPTQMQRVIDQPDYVEYQGRVRDKLVKVDFHDHDEDGVAVSFGIMRDDGDVDWEVTGEGDAYPIFAAVLDAMSQYIQSHDPQELEFHADKQEFKAGETGRGKLYTRMVNRFASGAGFASQVKDLGNTLEFRLKKQAATRGP